MLASPQIFAPSNSKLATSLNATFASRSPRILPYYRSDRGICARNKPRAMSLWPSILLHSPLPFDSTLSFKIFTFITYFSWILGTPTSSPHFGSIEQRRFAPTLIQIGVFRIHSQPAWQLGVSGTLKFPPFGSLARHCRMLVLCCLPIPRFSSAFPPLWPHLPWCFSSRLGSSSLAGSVIERGYCYGRNTHRKQFPKAPSRKQIPDGTLPMAPIRKLNPDGPALT